MNDLYAKALEELAQVQKRRIDSYFKHPGEKGRLNEHVVVDLIKQICPNKYSLGTGFIINSQGDISPQCDIVIYDDFHNRALFGDMTANIYPIECVYAFVEVKTTLTTTNLRESLDAIVKIRTMAKKGKYYKSRELIWQSTDADLVGQHVQVSSKVTLSPRSFIFAFDSDLVENTEKLTKCLRSECDEENKHFHGLLMLEKNLFFSRLPYKFDFPEFRIVEKRGLKAFLHTFLELIRDFPMGPMDLDRYLGESASVEKSAI